MSLVFVSFGGRDDSVRVFSPIYSPTRSRSRSVRSLSPRDHTPSCSDKEDVRLCSDRSAAFHERRTASDDDRIDNEHSEHHDSDTSTH